MIRRSLRLRNRPGFAMFMALGALVIIGVLVAGSSFITLQETRLGQNSIVQTRAFAAAEYGLNKIQADWDRTPNLTMEVGASFDTSYSVTGQGTSKVRISRLSNETFWLVSEGRASAGDATSAQRTAVKRVGAILRLRIPTIKAEGAVTTAGNVQVGGNANIKGANTNPPGWSGCASAADKAGLVIGTSATVSLPNDASKVSGSPQITQAAFATDTNTYVRFGDETWTQLTTNANITAADMVDGHPDTLPVPNGNCDRSKTYNYGEPWRVGTDGKTDAQVAQQCQNYFPVIYITASASSHGGRGQGILLVNGDLTFNAGFEWHGLIIVRDDIKKANGHAKIYGGIMARNAVAGDPTQDLTGTVDITYSACGLERAMRGSALVLQAKQRAWAELY